MVKKGVLKSFSEYPTTRITYCHSFYLPNLQRLITRSVFSNFTTFGIHPVKCQLSQTYVTTSTPHFCSAQARPSSVSKVIRGYSRTGQVILPSICKLKVNPLSHYHALQQPSSTQQPWQPLTQVWLCLSGRPKPCNAETESITRC